jgi:hypothetical protein
MEERVCEKCGGFIDPPEDMSLALWCDCPAFPIEPYPDEDIDPSEETRE